MKINFHRVLLGFLKTGINYPRKSGIRVQHIAIYQIERKNAIIQAYFLGELCPLNGSSAERGTKRTKDLDRSQHQKRPASPRGNPEREMCGVRKLTHTAYANQRIDA